MTKLRLWLPSDRRPAVFSRGAAGGGGHRFHLPAAPSGGWNTTMQSFLHPDRLLGIAGGHFSHLAILMHFIDLCRRLRWLPSSWSTCWACSNSSETSLICGGPARSNWSVCQSNNVNVTVQQFTEDAERAHQGLALRCVVHCGFGWVLL